MGRGHFIDWPTAMQFAFGVLRLSPQVFWSMTLPELLAVLPQSVMQPGLSQVELGQLMRDFPDHR